MATKKGANKKTAVTMKSILFDLVGGAVAASFPDSDVYRVKMAGTPEGILIDSEGKHTFINITDKKVPFEDFEGDIVTHYQAAAVEISNDEASDEE